MEHYGWCVGALWVVCGSIRERNYRLKKKNYLSGPTHVADTGRKQTLFHCKWVNSISYISRMLY